MLSDLNFDEMVKYVAEKGFPSFRGSQLFDGIYNGQALSEISTLPKLLKQQINSDYPSYKIFRKLTSKDGTKKYIIQMSDGEIVECVLMSYKHGNTLCLSTQVGCRMGCKFCASTLNGLVRNLSSGEILGQLLLINRDIGGSLKERKIINLVLMGSGEPLDNFDEVVKFLSLVTDEKGINISPRNISLSTCGLADKIYKLAENGIALNLTISLHSPFDEVRKTIMPIANRYTVKEIIESCKYYFNTFGRRIYFEYTVIKGKNDDNESARELARLVKGLLAHVNIIPLNEVKERGKGGNRQECYSFAKKLEGLGVSATVRRTMGEDILGACGQLRNKIISVEGK